MTAMHKATDNATELKEELVLHTTKLGKQLLQMKFWKLFQEQKL